MTVLVGGRYDGFLFGSDDGWKPGERDGVLYLSRPTAEAWDAAIRKAGTTCVTTTLVPVPFASLSQHDPFAKKWHDAEAYVRCPDGAYRTPSLARCR